MTRITRPTSLFALCLAIGLTAALSGCALEFIPDTPNENDNSNDNGSGENAMGVPDDSVQVRLRNLTEDQAVDVEVHVTAAPPDVLPDDLFAEENFFGVGIGLGGNGRIGPGEETSIELPCSEGMAVGTLGGAFLDVVAGEQQGHGNQLWLQEGAQFSCGAVILFEFQNDGDDYFATLFLLGR